MRFELTEHFDGSPNGRASCIDCSAACGKWNTSHTVSNWPVFVWGTRQQRLLRPSVDRALLALMYVNEMTCSLNLHQKRMPSWNPLEFSCLRSMVFRCSDALNCQSLAMPSLPLEMWPANFAPSIAYLCALDDDRRTWANPWCPSMWPTMKLNANFQRFCQFFACPQFWICVPWLRCWGSFSCCHFHQRSVNRCHHRRISIYGPVAAAADSGGTVSDNVRKFRHRDLLPTGRNSTDSLSSTDKIETISRTYSPAAERAWPLSLTMTTTTSIAMRLFDVMRAVGSEMHELAMHQIPCASTMSRDWMVNFSVHSIWSNEMEDIFLRYWKTERPKTVVVLTPPKSANPLMPSVSASDSSVDICSSNTFTSPEYMNVSSATTAPNDAPGITMTGWNGGSIVRNNSEKNELHALNTTRCARTVRPSADNVTSVRCDWSNNSGNDVSKLDCVARMKIQKNKKKKKNSEKTASNLKIVIKRKQLASIKSHWDLCLADASSAVKIGCKKCAKTADTMKSWT